MPRGSYRVEWHSVSAEDGHELEGSFSFGVQAPALGGPRRRSPIRWRAAALVGFDNWDVMIQGTRPPLTSVDMNLEQLGRTAARRLFSAIGAGTRDSGIVQLPCRVVPRESTAPAG